MAYTYIRFHQISVYAFWLWLLIPQWGLAQESFLFSPPDLNQIKAFEKASSSKDIFSTYYDGYHYLVKKELIFQQFQQFNSPKESGDAWLLSMLSDLSSGHSFFQTEVPLVYKPWFLTNLGHYYLHQGHLDTALQMFKDSSTRHLTQDDRWDNCMNIAHLYRESANYEQAHKYYLHCLDYSNDADQQIYTLYERARTWYQQDSVFQTIVILDTLQAQYPWHGLVKNNRVVLAGLYYVVGEHRTSIDMLEPALAGFQVDELPIVLLLLAQSYRKIGDMNSSIAYYRQFINDFPSHPQRGYADYGLGLVYFHQRIYHWSADSFELVAHSNHKLKCWGGYYQAKSNFLAGKHNLALNGFRNRRSDCTDPLFTQAYFYDHALLALFIGLYGEAVETLLTLIRMDLEIDKPGKVYTLLGEAFYANEEYSHSIEAFDYAESIYDVPKDIKAKALFQKAILFYDRGFYRDAGLSFIKVYKKYSNLKEEALFWAAESYYREKSFILAVKYYTSFLKEHPKSKYADVSRYSLAWAYFELGNYRRALVFFDHFLSKYTPNDSEQKIPYEIDARLRRGDSYFALSEYEHALSEYARMQNNKNGGDYALFQMARCYRIKKDSYQAVSSLRKLITQFPDSPWIRQGLSTISLVYMNIGNFSQAITELKKIIARFPYSNWSAHAQYLIGDAWYNMQQYDKAIVAYEAVLDDYPRSDWILESINGIGYALVAKGEKNRKNDILERFLLDFSDPEVTWSLRFKQADYRLQSGDYQKAIEDFLTYLDVTFSSKWRAKAHLKLAEAYYVMRNLTSVEAQLDALELLDNIDPDTYFGVQHILVRLYIEDSLWQKALDVIDDMDETRLLQTDILLAQSDAYYHLKQLDIATSGYQKVFIIDDSNPSAILGLARVAKVNRERERMLELLELLSKDHSEVGAEALFMRIENNVMESKYREALKHISSLVSLYAGFEPWLGRTLIQQMICYKQLGLANEMRKVYELIQTQYKGTSILKEAQAIIE